MIHTGPLDIATDDANHAVYNMSRAVKAAASGATPADAATAVFKLAASLDYMATALTAISRGQDTPTGAEIAALAESASDAMKAAQDARSAAQVTLDRHTAGNTAKETP